MTVPTVKNPFPILLPADFDVDHQATILDHRPGQTSSGRTKIYVHAAFPPSFVWKDEYPKTQYEVFNLGLASNPNGNCLGRRDWDDTTGDLKKSITWETYQETSLRRDVLGSAIRHIVGVGKDAIAGIWTSNRPEWQQVSLSLSSQSIPLVSLYDTLGPTAVHFCLQHAEISIAFVSAQHLPSLLELCGSKTPVLKTVVCVDRWEGGPGGVGARGLKDLARAWGKEKGVRVLDLTELEQIGREHPYAHLPPSPDTIASICYTSGTTGNPKGAILLHSTLAASVVSNLHDSKFCVGGVYFSYLPLSHIYERFCEDGAFCAGASIVYSCGDNLRLLEDLSIAQPTFFTSVPRVLNRIYQALKAATVDAPGAKGALMRKAFSQKLWNLKHKGQYTHAVWDRLVFAKVRALLGGKVVLIGSGSAPISPEVLAFLQVAFSCQVTEGYGQTENCGTSVKCVTGDAHPDGTCGPPQAGVECCLVDVPEMGYFSTDSPVPRGEICSRGPVVIPGYYKDPEKSAETIDQEGWLHSGDIASVDSQGRFRIIDRIKNLVKLSQGEYVALEKVENAYALCPLILQIYVHADSLQDHVVAIVVPDPEKLAPIASKVLGKHITPAEISTLDNNHPKLVAAIANELAPYAESANLQGYERVKTNIHISLEPFTMDNDLLTPTFKTKRNVAAQVYAKELQKLYTAAGHANKGKVGMVAKL